MIRVVINRSDFVETVISRVPEAGPTVRQSLEDNDGELLLHLLMADLRRLAIEWLDEGASEPLERLLAVVDAGLSQGDEYVENVVAVSFVEDSAWWEPTSQEFIATWPTGLALEVERQRRAWH